MSPSRPPSSQDNQSFPAYLVTYTTVDFGKVEGLRAGRTLDAGLATLLRPQTPSPVVVALAWPKNARVSPKGAEGGGGPKLVKFPPRDASGGVFASLQVWGPSLFSAGPFFERRLSFRGIDFASLKFIIFAHVQRTS